MNPSAIPCPSCASNAWEVVLLPPARATRGTVKLDHCPAFIRCQGCGREGPMVRADAVHVIEHACAVWNAMAEQSALRPPELMRRP